MLTALQGLSREERRQKVLCYDNMCHLNNLKVAKKPLPLPGHLSQLWFDVNKIIDSLHISNHKDQACKEMYSPAKIKEDHPNFKIVSINKIIFCIVVAIHVWFVFCRYKQILSSMPKWHHHFYLYRMVKKKNDYISRCYKEGRRPIAPCKHSKPHAVTDYCNAQTVQQTVVVTRQQTTVTDYCNKNNNSGH